MFRLFINEEEGQTTVEYLLIIAVVVVAVSVLGSTVKKNIGGVVQGVFDGINKKVGKLMNAANQE